MPTPTTIEATLVTRIQQNEALAALIGSGDGSRIYPGLIPQTEGKDSSGHTPPSISFRLVSAERISAFGSDTGLTRSRYQFSCWATLVDDARNMANLLRASLQRYRDYSGANGVPIQDSFLVAQLEQEDIEVESNGVIADYEIIWQEGVLT